MRLIDAHKYAERLNTIMQCWNCSSCLSPSEARTAVGHLQTAVSVLNEQPTVNPYEWISVEDRLPDELFMAVLIYCPDKNNIYCAYLNARNEWHIFDQGSGLWVLERVTHWMPLPSPPTDKEN